MMLNVGCGNAKATEKNSTKNNKRKSQEHRREIDYDGNNIEDDYDHEASISENNNSEVVVMSSPFPLAAKRRQFERHKCDPKMMIISNGNGAGVDGDDEEADDEEETRVQQIKTLDSHHLASCPVGGKLASNSLVTSKIGLFERLSYGAGAADSSTARGPAAPVRAPFFSRQPELDDELELHDGRRYVNNARHGDADHHLDDENEEVMFDEDDLDEEYLVLDTIVEEDEEQVSVMADGFSGVEVEGETKATRRQDEISCETGPLFGPNSSSLQQPKKQQQQQATTITQQADCAKCDDDDKLDCDRPAKLTRENNHQQKQQKLQQNATSINNNVHHQHHSSSNDAAFSTNCPRQVLNDEPAASPLVSEGAANKNNAADQRAAIANQSSATSERSVKQQQQQLQQPPAETRTSSLSSSSYSLSPFSPTPPSAAEGEGQNNKSCVEDVDNRKASAVAKQQQQQQVGGVVRADVSSASDVRHEDDDGGEAHRFGDGEPISAQLVSRTASDNMTSCNNNNYKQGPNTNARTSAATDNCDSLSHQAANSTMTSTNTNTTTVTTINTTKTPIADTTSSIINEKAEESRSRAQAAEQRRNIQAQTNKMHYQTLLPSTNRLISEHHARQQQALFRALNERQKILDELGPDERLEQGDLMSSSCVSLNLHHSGSKRQWRKSSARRAGGAEPRSRSSSASVHHQPNGAANNTSDHHHQLPSRHRRRATSKQSRGVPLSSVDLSSITDQQVDEILGQIAPASSSSSLVSSNASLSSGSSSSSSSGSFSSADDFSTSSSCSTDDDYDQNNDNNNATTGQDGLALDSANQKQNNKSQMLRRLRRRLADSEQRSSSSSSSLPAGGHHSTHANGLQQLSGGEPGFAPSVIGVHEDDSVSVNSARRSLRSSARKCREAFKKRGRNGRSDDEEDDNGDRRNQGDLFVSVASASSRGGDQQTSGLGANQGDGGGGRGSDQCSLSPLASHAQTTARCAAVSTAATIGSSSTAEYGAPTSHLLLTSTLRNHQLNTTGVTSSSQHHHHQQQHFDHHSLGSSSIAMSASQSPTTSDELTSLGHHQDHHHHSQPRRPQGGGQSVEAILSRMLGALDEIGAHDEPEQLNDLLERGFLHLEQLLNCSLTSQSSTLPRSQAKALHHQHPLGLGGLTQTPSLVHHPQQLLSQKDSDYGSDTQSNGECFSSSTSQPSQEQMGLASAAASGQAGSASISTGSGDNKRAGETSACSPASPRSPETVPGAASVMDRQHTGGTMPGSSLSPLAIELSFKLAESLRRLAQQQQANRQTQPEAFMATSSADSARESEPITRTVGPTTGSSGGGGDEQAPKARMKSVVMINSGGSTSRPQSAVGSVGGGNMTPVSSRPDEDDESAALIRGSGVVSPTLPLSPSSPSPSPLISRQTPESVAQQQQSTATSTIHSSRQQFKTRVNINGAKCELASQQAAPNSSSCEGTQIVKVIAGGGGAGQFGERVSRRSSFRNSSLRRRPSFSGSIASIHREPGAPRPGSPVPRSILELAAAAAASSSSNQANASIILPTSSPSSKPSGILSSRQNQLGAKMTTTTSESSHHQAGELEEFGAEQQQQQEQDGHNNSKQQQQHQLQRALILAQKYNYSPAKLATSKLSSKLHLKELIATTGNNYAAEQDDHQSSSERPSGDNSRTQLTAKATLAKGNIKPRNHGPSSQERRLLGLGDSAGKHFDVTGQVQLDISYFARTGSLTVHLLQCSQLEPVNKRRATSNPYVKLYLLPDRTRSGKRKSSVKRHQLNPKFDERFTFGPIQLHEFDSRTLWLSVWHKDRGLSRNEFLGELYLPMSRVRQQLLTSDLCQSISSRWYQLTSPLERSETLRQNERNPPVRQADGTLLTTKKLPLPAANGNGTIARGHTGKDIKTSGLIGASETDAVRKLSEFEKRAARLTQQHHLFAQQNSINPASASESPAADDEPATQQPLVHKSTSLGLMSDTSRHNRVQDEFGIAQGSPSYKTNISQQSIGLVGLNLNLDGPGQTPVKTMQVTLGPMQQQQPSDCSITGQMFVALKFVPESGELLAKRASAQVWGSLHVLIKEARDIGGFKSGSGAVASDQMPSPFCKCLLLDSNGHRMAKHRTNQLRRTNSPRWDQELVFPRLKVANLQAQAIEIQLFNRDSILVSSSEHLGSIRLCKRLKETASANARQEQRVEGEEGGEEMVVSTSTKTATGATTNMPSISSSSASLKSSTSSSASSNPTVDDDLCSEREARLWGQMLARPNIWVYGELPLRQLRPIVPLPITTPGTNSTDTNK